MLQLAQLVHVKADGRRWPGIFSHYFKTQDQVKVEAFFRGLMGAMNQNDPGNAGPGGGSPSLARIRVTNKWLDEDGDPDRCHDPATIAWLSFYASRPEADLRLCDFAYQWPLTLNRKCEDMDNVVSGKMSTLSRIILHELAHFNAIGIPATGKSIIDYGTAGYGPVNTRTFKNNQANDPANNADNYRWFAQEFWWSAICGKDYGDATSNKEYVDCKDAAGNQVACEMSAISRPEKPSNSPQPSKTPSPPSPPPAPPAKTKALAIILQNYIDEITNENSWLFFTTARGVSPLCRDDKDRTNVGKYPAKGNSNMINNPPWPGGSFKIKIDGMGCEYKNDGTNPGALWCQGRDVIPCQEEYLKGKGKDGTKACGPKIIWSVEQHPVAYCEW